MRKSFTVYLAAIGGILLFSLLFSMGGHTGKIVRYHQHREEPSEEELGVCEACRGEGPLCTHLPIISIDTGGQKIPGGAYYDENGITAGYERTEQGENQILVRLKVIDQADQWHHPEDEPSVTSQAAFRIRGKSSRHFSKKNYRIQLVSEGNPEENKKRNLLGMGADSEWALHGPFLDKTLIRNYMWMNLSAEVMGDAPDVRFCELILDGAYQGVYVLMETVREGEGRVDLTDYDEKNVVFSYIVHLEPQKSKYGDPVSVKSIEDFSFYTRRYEEDGQMELLYPRTKDQTDQVKQYVTEDLSDIEHYLYSQEMEKDPDSCWKYLDLNSFANYYILQEYLAITDMFSASTYLYKDVRGKLHIGPVWDYNNALNNFFTELPPDEFLLTEKGWYTQLMKSERFVRYTIARYRKLRKGVLAEKAVEAYAREVKAWLGEATDRNYKVWGYSFDSSRLSQYERRGSRPGEAGMEPKEMNPSSYEEAMEWMLDYAAQRGAWLDRNINSLLQYCHPSRNASGMFD